LRLDHAVQVKLARNLLHLFGDRSFVDIGSQGRSNRDDVAHRWSITLAGVQARQVLLRWWVSDFPQWISALASFSRFETEDTGHSRNGSVPGPFRYCNATKIHID
jgi:hypothetical protein